MNLTASLLSAQAALPPATRVGTVSISIIVPCWRGDAVPATVAAGWLAHAAVREVIVAACADDGAGGGNSARPAGPDGLRVIRCPRHGRGHQMNHAARHATGDLLLFHHADTELTDAHFDSLRAAADDPAVGGGAFRRRFDERHPHLRWLEPWEAWRCRRFGPLFGDQSIFVRREWFDALGGYADLPLMEDVEFTCRLRRRSGVTLLTPAIGSSARKHLQQGHWRTTLTNASFLLLYVCGVSPHRLHRWYYRRRITP